VVLDLVGEVARHEMEERAPVQVAGAQELADVPASAALGLELLLRERLGAFGDVTHEHDGVHPHVPDHVRGEGSYERVAGGSPGQKWEDDVVLAELADRLARERDELFPGL